MWIRYIVYLMYGSEHHIHSLISFWVCSNMLERGPNCPGSGTLYHIIIRISKLFGKFNYQLPSYFHIEFYQSRISLANYHGSYWWPDTSQLPMLLQQSCWHMAISMCSFHIKGAPIPDSKVHGADMGPTWGRQDPGGTHVGPMNCAIWDVMSWKKTLLSTFSFLWVFSAIYILFFCRCLVLFGT